MPGWNETALWWPERRTLVVTEAIGRRATTARPGQPVGVNPVLRRAAPADGAAAAIAPEHLLVGHGAGLHEDAAAALGGPCVTRGATCPRVVPPPLRRGPGVAPLMRCAGRSLHTRPARPRQPGARRRGAGGGAVLPLFVLDDTLLGVSRAAVGAARRALPTSTARCAGSAPGSSSGAAMPVAETVKAARACDAEARVPRRGRLAVREAARAGGCARALDGADVPRRHRRAARRGRAGRRATTTASSRRTARALGGRTVARRSRTARRRAAAARGGAELRRLPEGVGGAAAAARRRRASSSTSWLAGGARGLRRGARRARGRRDVRLSIPTAPRPALAARGGDAQRERASSSAQLCWRDFYAQLLAAHPRERDARPIRTAREWRDDADGLAAWKEGLTGYPSSTPACASWPRRVHAQPRAAARRLVPDQGPRIDWREGAAHFEALLLDGDVASNRGNWQWVAGTGVDTRPGRIFNPTVQGKRFDPRRRLRPPLGARARRRRRRGGARAVEARPAAHGRLPGADRGPRRGGGALPSRRLTASRR